MTRATVFYTEDEELRRKYDFRCGCSALPAGAIVISFLVASHEGINELSDPGFMNLDEGREFFRVSAEARRVLERG